METESPDHSGPVVEGGKGCRANCCTSLKFPLTAELVDRMAVFPPKIAYFNPLLQGSLNIRRHEARTFHVGMWNIWQVVRHTIIINQFIMKRSRFLKLLYQALMIVFILYLSSTSTINPLGSRRTTRNRQTNCLVDAGFERHGF